MFNEWKHDQAVFPLKKNYRDILIPLLCNFLSLSLCLETFPWDLEVLGVMWWKSLQQSVYSANTVLPVTVLSTRVPVVTSKKQTWPASSWNIPCIARNATQVGTSYSSFFLWIKNKIFPGNTDTKNSPDSKDHLCKEWY